MTHTKVLGAANDLRSAHLLLLANHGELTNIAATQLRDALDVASSHDEGSRAVACNARFLEAQMLLRSALAKMGVRERRELASLTIPSRLCDALGGVFDAIVVVQDFANVDANRQLAARVAYAYDALHAWDPRIPPLTPIDAPTTSSFADGIGVVAGQHPMFWDTSRWVMLFGGVFAVIAFVIYVAIAAR